MSNKQKIASVGNPIETIKLMIEAISANIFKGRKNSVKTAKGTKIDTVLALVEADKLIVSHSAGGQENPNYPQELQPRDRSRDTSQAQIQRIANNLNPEDLGRNGRADSGAPIVGNDLVVESGNGRTIAIKLAYELGKAEEYKEFLRNEADYFGFSVEQVDKLKQPILVRIRLSEVDRAQFAIEANQDDKLSQTATERAKQDSKRIDNNLLMLFTPSEDGDFLAASNNKFIQGFLARLGADESAQYVDSNGKPTQALVARMKAAIFAKAYNDDRLLEMMADQSKPELQNMLNALSIAAPKFVEAQGVSRGDIQDLSENLVTGIEQSLDQKVMNAIIDATNVLITAKKNNQDITEFVKQQGLFGDLPEGVAELAIFISQNNRSAKKMSIFFKALAEFVEKQGIDNQNLGLFGEPEPVKIQDAFNYAIEIFEQTYKENANLSMFDSMGGNSSLVYWMNNIADIPIKDDDGVWYDAEDGATFESWKKGSFHQELSKPKERYVPSKNVAAARAFAKQYSGSALTGTKKQKDWAEIIRADILSKQGDEVGKSLLARIHQAKSSKFWIENRGSSLDELIAYAQRYSASVKALNQISRLANAVQDLERTDIITRAKPIFHGHRDLINQFETLTQNTNQFKDDFVYKTESFLTEMREQFPDGVAELERRSKPVLVNQPKKINNIQVTNNPIGCIHQMIGALNSGKIEGFDSIEDYEERIKRMEQRKQGGIDELANEAATSPENNLPEPTEQQKIDGNYKKGLINYLGLNIAIENPANSIRMGFDENGKRWENKLTAHYGYIQDTKGFDGDELDVFVKSGVKGFSEKVFIVRQVDPISKEFDEHKIILGASNIEDARQIYLSNYEENWQGLESIYEISIDELKSKLNQTWGEFDSIENAFDDVSLDQGIEGAFIGINVHQNNATSILRSMLYQLQDNERWQQSNVKHETYLVQSEKLAIPDSKNSLAPEFMRLKHGTSNHGKVDISHDYKEGKKLLAKALKKAFPNVRFSIKSVYGGYRVSWVNGASEALVSQITNHFESRGRGQMDATGDYWESGSSKSAVNADGQVVNYGLGEIELHRSYSQDFIISVLATIKAKRMKLVEEDTYRNDPEGEFFRIEYASGSYGGFERDIVKIVKDYNDSSYLAYADTRRWGGIDLLKSFSENVYSVPEVIKPKINQATQIIDQDEESAVKITTELESDKSFIDKVLAGEIEVNADSISRALSMLSEKKIDELAEYSISQVLSQSKYDQTKNYLDDVTGTPEQKLKSNLAALAFEECFIEHVTAKGKSIYGFVLAAKGVKKEIVKEFDKYTFFKNGWFIRESGIKELPSELLSEKQILAKEVLKHASVSNSGVESTSELHSTSNRSGNTIERWSRLEQLVGKSGSESRKSGTQRNGSDGISKSNDASVSATGHSGNELSLKSGATSHTTDDSSRSNTSNGDRSPTRTKRDRSIIQSAKSVRAELDAKSKLQLAADNIQTEWADKQNIEEALPYLLPEQRDDVLKAEQQLIQQNKNGILFTNGTGTGKTFTGLGAVKRSINAGRTNILIVTLSDKICRDFVKSGKPLNIDIHQLDGVSDNGGKDSNIVVTTYANFGQNMTLGKKDWDLIIVDEAHILTQNEKGDDTKALSQLRALSGHHAGFRKWVKQRHSDKLPKLDEQGKVIDQDELIEWENFIKPLRDDWMKRWSEQGKGRAKVIFLSATPFSYVKSVEWAEGYLFNFTEPSKMFTPENDAQGSGYNKGDDRESFYMRNFGYRMRYNKLTRPEGKVDSGVFERQFAEELKKNGSMSGRDLVINFDYDRKFVLLKSKAGELIDEGFDYISNTKNEKDERVFSSFSQWVYKRFDYLTRRRLLEAIKAEEGIPYFKKHLALGRKIVIFYDYNKGGGIKPFKFSEHLFMTNNGEMDEAAYAEYQVFAQQRPDLVNLSFDYNSPLSTLKRAFPKALVFNGKVSKSERQKAVDLFNTDNNGYDVLLVQSDAGSTGISLHDTTGTHQRVSINIGQPIKPAKLRQTEGRTYRVGQSSNAIQRYLTTGTGWERAAFAETIAGRAETVDNLAKGEDALSSIKQALIVAYENADFEEPSLTDGTGGKAFDEENARISKLSPFDKAMTYYYAKGKNTASRNNREGKEWYATPEPLGYKMLEWAGVHTGDKVLEPSAGDGAIARFAPEDVQMTMIEPTESLASRARMANTSATLIESTFENHDSINKYHAIVMNPPFGKGGSLAIQHVRKAFDHLYEGGRIVALIPLGSMDDKISNWIAEEKNAYITGEIMLPSATFKNAGTAINTRIVLIEKHENPQDAPNYKSYNFTSIDSPEELFEKIRYADMRPRKPRIDEQLNHYGLELIVERKKYILTGDGLKNPTLTRLLSQYWWAELVNDEIVMDGNKTAFILKEIKQYEKDNQVSLAIGT